MTFHSSALDVATDFDARFQDLLNAWNSYQDLRSEAETDLDVLWRSHLDVEAARAALGRR